MSGLPGSRVSVILASYNHAAYVREAIESVWAQTHPDVELVVVDDGSTDGSQDVLRAAKAERDFILIENAENIGLNPSIEVGVRAASGDYMCFLASDDFMDRTKLARQVAFLHSTGCEAVYATGWKLLPGGQRVLMDDKRVADAFRDGTALKLMQTTDTEGPLVQSALFSAEVYRSLAWIRQRFRSDDWAVAIWVLTHHRVGYLSEPVFTYRQHDSNTHRKYWATFPMRVDVISTLTPPEHRREALANLLESQATHLALDGQMRFAVRLIGAAMLLDARGSRPKMALKLLARPAAHRLGLTRGQRAVPRRRRGAA